MTRTVRCPTCGKPVIWAAASTWRPFCSDRCRLIDLGEWLDETRRISEPLEEALLDHGLDPSDDAPRH